MSFESHRWGTIYEIWQNGESHTHSLKIMDYEKCDHSWFFHSEKYVFRQLYCQLKLIRCKYASCMHHSSMYWVHASCIMTVIRSMWPLLHVLRVGCAAYSGPSVWMRLHFSYNFIFILHTRLIADITKHAFSYSYLIVTKILKNTTLDCIEPAKSGWCIRCFLYLADR